MGEASHEELLIALSGAMQRIPEFRAEVEALLADYRTRCLKWLLAEAEPPAPAKPAKGSGAK